MSEKNTEVQEASAAVPGEAAPAAGGIDQLCTCADPAQASNPVGTQAPPLEDQETPAPTGSPTTDSGYAEAVSNRKPAEEKEKGTLHAAPLCVPSSPPDPQPSGPTPIPVQDMGADIQPEFEGADLIATSTPPDDDNVFTTPAASPTHAPEGEDGSRTPPATLPPQGDAQLRVSPKRKVETMEVDMDSEAKLPAFQKKARADSGNDSGGECYQWDDIPHQNKQIDVSPVDFPGGMKPWCWENRSQTLVLVETCPVRAALKR